MSSVTPAHLNAWRDLLKHYADFLSSKASLWIVGRSGQENPGVTKAKEFVASQNGGNVSLKEVADHVHLNKHYFCRLFKRTTGMTFSQYACGLCQKQYANGLCVCSGGWGVSRASAFLEEALLQTEGGHCKEAMNEAERIVSRSSSRSRSNQGSL